MKTHLWLLIVVIALFISRGSDAKLRKWNQKMQELSATFSDLLPELSESRPYTPASQKKLERGTKKLMSLAHSINMGPGTSPNPLPPEADPTIRFVSDMFEREIKSAHKALQAGHVGYAKNVLRAMSGYCIACHTRHDAGPDFPGIALSPKTEALPPMEKAELLAATRQFDAALTAFEALAGDPLFAKSNPIQWGRAVHHAFTISVRVKKNPDQALSLMEKVEKLPEVPPFFAIHIPAWKKSLQDWKGESPKKLDSEDALLAEAERLNKQAQELQQYPSDRAADVLYLRSSAALHELLTKYPSGKKASEALYLAGMAYNLLEDRLTSALPDLYFESCIRNTPHTAISEKCYERFEQNMIFGYSGSAGTFVPGDIQTAMKELRTLAKKK